MDEKIILAIDFNVESDKADKIWVEVYNHDPRAVAELLVLVDRLIERDHADESLVKDERFADAILALEPRYDGDILLNSPFVIAEKDKFIDENERWLSYDTLDVDSDILWENRFDVYNSGGYEVVTIRIFLQGKILADGISFYNGYYEDCPESYYHDDSISEYFYSAFEWEGQTPSVDDITVYRGEEEKPEVSEKARQWEERWHKRSKVSQRSQREMTDEEISESYKGFKVSEFTWTNKGEKTDWAGGGFSIEFPGPTAEGDDAWYDTFIIYNAKELVDEQSPTAMKIAFNHWYPDWVSDKLRNYIWEMWGRRNKAIEWQERWFKRSSLVKKALDYKEFEIERIPYGTDEDMFLVYNAIKSGIGVQLTVELLDNDMQTTVQNYWQKVVYDWENIGSLPEYQEGLRIYEEKLSMLKNMPASDKARQWEERWHKRSKSLQRSELAQA